MARPAVVEAPVGTTAHELVARCGGMRDGRRLLAFLPGGASTGFLPAAQADLPLDWEPLREAGSGLGSAAVLVVAEGADLLALAGNLTAFFRNESCGKCVPCRIGTEKAVALIEQREPAGLARLHALHEAMAATSICGLGQAALKPVLSVLDGFGAAGRGPGMTRVTLHIDDRELTVPAGTTLWEAARGAGIEIPVLCHDPKLEPVGVCRLCAVEVEGERVFAAACIREAADGMVVRTRNEKLERCRDVLTELLLSEQPARSAREATTGDDRLLSLARNAGRPGRISRPPTPPGRRGVATTPRP